jgi:membrane protease YdiL (CAAX protease family)
MVSIGSSEFILALGGLLFMAIGTAIVMTWSWLIIRLFTDRPILPVSPMVPRRQTPWGIMSIVLTIAVYLVITIGAITVYAVQKGRFAPQPPANLPKTTIEVAEAPALSLSELMSLSVASNAVLLVVIPLLLRLTCGARLRDFGISFQGWWRQAALGCVATLAAAPIVYTIQFTAVKVFENHEHPLQKMLMKNFSPAIAELAILTAVIAAPLFEELFFRGIIQSWLVGLSGWLNRVSATRRLAERVVEPARAPGDLSSEEGAPSPWEADLAEFTATPEPQAPSTEFDANPPTPWRAIIASSLFFAAVHGSQWPAPLGLFVLAVVIGTVYYRTGSLIAAIFMHATFNGISTLMMIFALLATQIKDSKKPPLPQGQPAAVHSSLTIDSGWMH